LPRITLRRFRTGAERPSYWGVGTCAASKCKWSRIVAKKEQVVTVAAGPRNARIHPRSLPFPSQSSFPNRLSFLMSIPKIGGRFIQLANKNKHLRPRKATRDTGEVELGISSDISDSINFAHRFLALARSLVTRMNAINLGTS